jgi:hypothetical protein
MLEVLEEIKLPSCCIIEKGEIIHTRFSAYRV